MIALTKDECTQVGEQKYTNGFEVHASSAPYGVHGKDVELLATILANTERRVVKVGIGRLCGDLSRDADTQQCVESMPLADHARRVRDEVTLSEHRTHDGAGDTLPVAVRCWERG